MSTQYTNQAKTAVKYAEKTARRYKHSYIGTEHLLAGLLHEEEGTAGMVLRDMGISEERLMEMIRKLIAPEESNVLTADRAGYTPRATRMLEGAVEEDRTVTLVNLLNQSGKQEEMLMKLADRMGLTERYKVMTDRSLYRRRENERDVFAPQAVVAA